MCPKKKDDLVAGKYELSAPEGQTNVAVKIIDMLGEEVLIVESVWKKAKPDMVRLSMSLQVYFRQLSATDTVLDAKHNGFQSVISIML